MIGPLVIVWVALSFLLAWGLARWFQYLRDGK